MAGDITGTLNGNIAEVTGTALTQTIGAGNTLRLDSNGNHNGDPTQGFLITINCNGTRPFDLQMEGPGTFEMHDLHMRWVLDTAPRNMIQVRTIVTSCQVNLHDLLLDANSLAQSCIRVEDADPVLHIDNCVAWEYTEYGYIFTAANAGNLIENNAAYNGTAFDGFYAGNVGGTYLNNTSYNNTGVDYTLIGAATGTNNRSSDATAANANWAVGVGNETLANVALDVQGVNDALANFFDIIVGGPLDSSGVANGIAARTVGIRNRAVPNYLAGTSKGPAEIPAVITPTPTARGGAVPQPHIAIRLSLSLD